MQPNPNNDTSQLKNKDLEIYEASKQKTKSFIDQLNQKKLLRDWITPEENALVETVLDRINEEGISIAKLERIIGTEKVHEFVQSLTKFGIDTQDIMNYYSGLLVHQILDINELFKKYLVPSLDKKALSLTGKESLGQLLFKLEQVGIDHGFYEFLDKDLRNALGHGWYWFKNNRFYYVVDPELKRTKDLSLGELFIKMRKTALLTKGFADSAFERMGEIKQSGKMNVTNGNTNNYGPSK